MPPAGIELPKNRRTLRFDAYVSENLFGEDSAPACTDLEPSAREGEGRHASAGQSRRDAPARAPLVDIAPAQSLELAEPHPRLLEDDERQPVALGKKRAARPRARSEDGVERRRIGGSLARTLMRGMIAARVLVEPCVDKRFLPRESEWNMQAWVFAAWPSSSTWSS